MESFHAAVQHLGEAGEVGDIAHGEIGFAEGLGRASGGDEFYTVMRKRSGEFDEAGFVGDGKEGAADGFEVGGHTFILEGLRRGEPDAREKAWLRGRKAK